MPRCPERELLESDLKQAVKRWTDMEDKATVAIGNADPDANEYLAHTYRARAAMRKARTDLDNQVAFHRCSSPGDEGCGEDGLIARA
jgi:hypothetical protein